MGLVAGIEEPLARVILALLAHRGPFARGLLKIGAQVRVSLQKDSRVYVRFAEAVFRVGVSLRLSQRGVDQSAMGSDETRIRHHSTGAGNDEE